MSTEHNKAEQKLIADQLTFFAKNRAGCAFAAVAARDPDEYGWKHVLVPNSQIGEIDELLRLAIADEQVSTLALIFPDVRSEHDLDEFILKLATDLIILHEVLETGTNWCLRFRAVVSDEQSYISGFGPFESMPVTRQSPHTMLVMRVKPRPDYDWFLKEPDEGIIHIADMDMKGLPDRTLKRMWKNSFLSTAGLLGKKPDQESAAKTTFVIPADRAAQISIASVQE